MRTVGVVSSSASGVVLACGEEASKAGKRRTRQRLTVYIGILYDWAAHTRGMTMTMTTAPEGYLYDDPALPASPVTREDLELLQRCVLWTDADRDALRAAGRILVGQTEAILDVWYGFVASNPQLVAAFAGADGQPDGRYLAAVRARFGRWIEDLCTRDFDETWLAYQEEIAFRHHSTKKNQTDGVASRAGHVELRYLIALAVPITVTIRDFLAAGAADPGTVDAMYHAWFKAVVLSVALWARPYSPALW